MVAGNTANRGIVSLVAVRLLALGCIDGHYQVTSSLLAAPLSGGHSNQRTIRWASALLQWTELQLSGASGQYDWHCQSATLSDSEAT